MTACAGRSVPPPVVDRNPFAAIPAELTACKDQPLVPAPDPSLATPERPQGRVSAADSALFLSQTIDAGCDCRSKVAAIRALREGRGPGTVRCLTEDAK